MKKYFKKIIQFLKKGLNSKLWVLLGNVGGAGLGFLSFVFLAQYLTQVDFGRWLLYLAGFSLFEMLRTGIIYQALVQKLAIASSEDAKLSLLSSAWLIMLIFTSVISLMLWSINILFNTWVHQIQMEIFFNAYPIAMWAILPMNMTMWRANAEQKFKLWSILQILPNACFVIFIPIVIFFKWQLYEIVLGHIFFRAFLSLVYIRLSAIDILRKKDFSSVSQLIGFGKHSILSTLGTHLLKSSDVFIIGYFWGAKSVALYNLPLKLIELAEIPLRAFAFTVFPQIAKSFGKGDTPQILALLRHNLIFSYMTTLPLILGMYIFSYEIILWIGGQNYQESVLIFRLFLIYLCLLPLDRLLGVTLDSVNLPHINSQKVWIMLIINILGDMWVVFFLGQLWGMVWISLLNSIFGVLLGVWHLRKILFSRKIVLLA